MLISLAVTVLMQAACTDECALRAEGQRVCTVTMLLESLRVKLLILLKTIRVMEDVCWT
jgi:hypothetical protein